MEHEGEGDTICGWYTWDNPQRIGKGTRRLRNKRTIRDHSDYSIKIGQNSEKSPGDLRRFTVTQTPERNHQLTLMWNTLSLSLSLSLRRRRRRRMKRIKFSGLCNTNGHQIGIRRSEVVLIDKRERSCHLKDFSVAAGYSRKIKENKIFKKIHGLWLRTKESCRAWRWQ